MLLWCSDDHWKGTEQAVPITCNTSHCLKVGERGVASTATSCKMTGSTILKPQTVTCSLLPFRINLIEAKVTLCKPPVEPERGCLPSPEELKGKILVKVRMHVCYIGLMYVHTYVLYMYTYVYTCILLCVHTVHTYVRVYLLPVLVSILRPRL